MKTNLYNRIKTYLEYVGSWKNKDEIIDAMKQAYYVENDSVSSDAVSRRLRELTENGDIQVEYYKGKKKQNLAKYASCSSAKEPKQSVSFVERDGKIIAVIN